MPNQGQNTYRISLGEMVFVITIAGMVDIVTLVPFVGTIVGPTFWVIMSFYLLFRGAGLLNVKTVVTGLMSTIIEIFPAIQALPAITAGTVIIFVLLRVEDKTGLKMTGKNMASNIANVKKASRQIRTTGSALNKVMERRAAAELQTSAGPKARVEAEQEVSVKQEHRISLQTPPIPVRQDLGPQEIKYEIKARDNTRKL